MYLVAPDAPLPTRPPEPTKKTIPPTTESEIQTVEERETPVMTVEVTTTAKPTPPLFFSLPEGVTDVDIFDLQTTKMAKTTSSESKIPSRKSKLASYETAFLASDKLVVGTIIYGNLSSLQLQ